MVLSDFSPHEQPDIYVDAAFAIALGERVSYAVDGGPLQDMTLLGLGVLACQEGAQTHEVPNGLLEHVLRTGADEERLATYQTDKELASYVYAVVEEPPTGANVRRPSLLAVGVVRQEVAILGNGQLREYGRAFAFTRAGETAVPALVIATSVPQADQYNFDLHPLSTDSDIMFARDAAADAVQDLFQETLVDAWRLH